MFKTKIIKKITNGKQSFQDYCYAHFVEMRDTSEKTSRMTES